MENRGELRRACFRQFSANNYPQSLLKFLRAVEKMPCCTLWVSLGNSQSFQAGKDSQGKGDHCLKRSRNNSNKNKTVIALTNSNSKDSNLGIARSLDFQVPS